MNLYPVVSMVIVFAIMLVSIECNARVFKLNKESVEGKLPEVLANAQTGDTILLPEGEYFFTRGLQLVGKQIAISGAGANRTVLNFEGQKSTAQALLVRGWDMELKGFSVTHPLGDGIVIRNSGRVRLQDIRVDMSRRDTKVGAYAIYPVSSRHITIDSVEVSGASDAGIYLGQSMFANIRNSVAYENVTGLNIENSVSVNIENNSFSRNTVGAFICSRPDMIYPSSKNIVLSGNSFKGNNLKNFSLEGALVRKLKKGVGLQLVAIKDMWLDKSSFEANSKDDIVVAHYSYLNEPPAPGTFNPENSGLILSNPHTKLVIAVDEASANSISSCKGDSVALELLNSRKNLSVAQVECSGGVQHMQTVELPIAFGSPVHGH